ncbi:MAG: synthase gamma subunit [Candidatus Kaiserbacteria bacterium]|nr:synthase gamma subunit [Candidatus Kaiserbacteria bacterium]
MSQLAEIRRSVESYRMTGFITGALQEISAVKMQDLRRQFEQNALFFAGVRDVYAIVKAHADDIIKKANETPKPQPRDIYIGLTSNRRFNGTLNRDIVRSLVAMLGTVENSDFLIIGLTGAQYLEETSVPDKVKRSAFDDDIPNTTELQNILSLITEYRRVFVVYPKFVNPFRQDVVMTDITQTPTVVTPVMKADYIFEPEIEGMLAFFEAQVRRALFERILLETELARAASRTIKMQNARDRANNLRDGFQQDLRHEYASQADIELLETFIGFSFWKHTSGNTNTV